MRSFNSARRLAQKSSDVLVVPPTPFAVVVELICVFWLLVCALPACPLTAVFPACPAAAAEPVVVFCPWTCVLFVDPVPSSPPVFDMNDVFRSPKLIFQLRDAMGRIRTVRLASSNS